MSLLANTLLHTGADERGFTNFPKSTYAPDIEPRDPRDPSKANKKALMAVIPAAVEKSEIFAGLEH